MTTRKTVSTLIAASALVLTLTPSQAHAWRFLVAGDTRGNTNTGGAAQVNTTIVTEIGNAAVAEGAQFILSTGDQVNSGSDATYNTTAFNTYKSAITAGGFNINNVLPVMGNHDFLNSNITNSDAAYKAAFNYLPTNGPLGVEQGRTYAVTYNNALFLALDEYATSYQVNEKWLYDQLHASNRPEHVFVFGHLPAFQVTTHHPDTLDDHPAARNTFWQDLKDAGARVYFAGHEHFYDRTQLLDGDSNPNNDIMQIVTGTGGAQLTTNAVSYDFASAVPYTPTNIYHEAQYGYVIVDVDGDNVSMTWKHRVSPGVYTAVPGGETLSYTVTPAPLPASVGLGALGLTMLGGLRLRRRAS